MERKGWVRLDHASNIFLAARNSRDTKVFRLTAELEDEVDPVLLQRALDKTYAQYLLYHSVLRRGFFWYYLEMSDLKPQVAPELLPPCAPIYHFDHKELLFRVIYRADRIHFEIFHVLADGTGALWFFEDLIKEYIFLRYPESFCDMKKQEREWKDQQTADSFSHYFRPQRAQNFTESAYSAFRSVISTSKKAGKLALRLGKKTSNYVFTDHLPTEKKRKVYQVKGKKTPDNRMRVVEMSLPTKQVLALAREQKTSVMIYLIALFFESIRKASPDFQETGTVSVSVPVNLRQFYPSNSARNFFLTTRLEYTYGKEMDNVTNICQKLSEQLQYQLRPELVDEKMNKQLAFEYNFPGRLIFRPLKDMILKFVNLWNNQNLTIAISNMGRVDMPEAIGGRIQQLVLLTSAVRPQFCMISSGEKMTICFTSPFIDTTIQKEFARQLTKQGVVLEVAANQVTAAELEE